MILKTTELPPAILAVKRRFPQSLCLSVRLHMGRCKSLCAFYARKRIVAAPDTLHTKPLIPSAFTSPRRNQARVYRQQPFLGVTCQAYFRCVAAYTRMGLRFGAGGHHATEFLAILTRWH